MMVKYISKIAEYKWTLRKCKANNEIATSTEEGEEAFESIKNAIAYSNNLAMLQ
jgi:hypothetical protein